MDVTSLIEVMGTFGLPAALLVYILLRTGKREDAREDRMSAAITKLEQFQQTELLETTKMLVGVVERNTAALNEVSGAIRRCSRNGELGKDG